MTEIQKYFIFSNFCVLGRRREKSDFKRLFKDDVILTNFNFHQKCPRCSSCVQGLCCLYDHLIVHCAAGDVDASASTVKLRVCTTLYYCKTDTDYIPAILYTSRSLFFSQTWTELPCTPGKVSPSLSFSFSFFFTLSFFLPLSFSVSLSLHARTYYVIFVLWKNSLRALSFSLSTLSPSPLSLFLPPPLFIPLSLSSPYFSISLSLHTD